MKILVCGGRHYANYARVEATLSPYEKQIKMLIHGGAQGADRMAEHWASAHGVHYARVPALWGTFGRAAGPKRNVAMLELKPDRCIAFPGGRGTASMVQLCRQAGIQVVEVCDLPL